MQENAEDGGAREAELLEVLSAYAEPRAVSFRFVAGFVLLGLVSCASLAWLVAGAPRREPLRLEPSAAAGFQRGVGAFRAADWDEALRLMREAQSALDEPLPRVEDFVERLELILRDEERLSRVEQALAESDPARALSVAALIAPNSPLFAQAEGLERKARTQLQASTPSEREQPVAAPGSARELNLAQDREPSAAAAPSAGPRRRARRVHAQRPVAPQQHDQPEAW
jgi:hypothetical protein